MRLRCGMLCRWAAPAVCRTNNTIYTRIRKKDTKCDNNDCRNLPCFGDRFLFSSGAVASCRFLIMKNWRFEKRFGAFAVFVWHFSWTYFVCALFGWLLRRCWGRARMWCRNGCGRDRHRLIIPTRAVCGGQGSCILCVAEWSAGSCVEKKANTFFFIFPNRAIK